MIPGDGRFLQLVLQIAHLRRRLLVLARPGDLLLFELGDPGLEALLVGVAILDRLREFDDLVLELVGDLLELRSRLGLDPEHLELLSCHVSSVARLEMDYPMDVGLEVFASQAERG